MTMGLRFHQVDAFTDRPFAGNPAAVVLLPSPKTERWMQDIAIEMNLSETAFLVQTPGGYGLRWFTPEVEVDLCGHATLASAHVLWEEGLLKPGEPARFSTKSGVLGASKKGDWIELDFPAKPERPAPPPEDLAKALGVAMTYVGKNQFDYIVEVASEETVRTMNPDHGILSRLGVRGVIVTSRSSAGKYDFVSRFFAPGAGIAEDPVTGSAHCCLGPYWKERLGKSEFLAYQASRRGGILKVRVGDGGRVYIQGQAVTVLTGEILGS
jgi:PhzF family phenazine biosynthesis protein